MRDSSEYFNIMFSKTNERFVRVHSYCVVSFASEAFIRLRVVFASVHSQLRVEICKCALILCVVTNK